MRRDPILLVEDNPDDIALTLRAFKKANLLNEIVVAEDGVTALAHLLPAPGTTVALRPCVVLLDLKLPLIDGHTVLRQLRSHPRTRQLPVVILTTSAEERDLTEAYRNGANSYVRKPVDFLEFIEAARVLGLYWAVLNKQPDS